MKIDVEKVKRVALQSQRFESNLFTRCYEAVSTVIKGVDDETDVALLPVAVFRSLKPFFLRVIPFKSLGYAVFKGDDLSFEIVGCDPEQASEQMSNEMNKAVEDGTVAWALYQNRPVVIPAHQPKQNVVLHVLSTRRRAIGAFIGYFDGSEKLFPEDGLKAISLVCSAAAHALEVSLLRGELSEYLRQSEKRTERDSQVLSEELRKAEESSRAKSEFLINLSHDIRTPMNGIIGMTSLLLEKKLAQQHLELVEIIRESADDLMVVLNDILDFAKIDAGSFYIDNVDFDLRRLVDDIEIRSGELAARHQTRIAFDIRHDVPALVKGDPGRLRQVLSTVINTVLERTDHSTVKASVSLLNETPESVSIQFKIDWDSTKLAAVEARTMLAANTEVSSPNSVRREVLSLSLASQLIELMDGTLQVQASEDVASFDIIVRLEKQRTDHAIILSSSGFDLRGANILVVNDQVADRYVYDQLLAKHGANATCVTNSADGLSALKGSLTDGPKIDAVVLDLGKAVEAAEKFCTSMQSEKKLINIPLAMIATNGQRGDVARLKQAGFSAYLTRPVKVGVLLDCLNAMVSAPRDWGRQKNSSSMVTKHTIEEARKAGARILVAEDNAVNQKVMTRVLEKLGYSADVVGDGEKAIRALTSVPYSLVMMDVQMPVMDGVEATKAIRSSDSEVIDRQIPIIAITAQAMHGDRKRLLDVGMNDYIAKPVVPQELQRVIRSHLHLPSARSSLDEEIPKESPMDVDPMLGSDDGEQVLDCADMLERVGNDSATCDEILNLFVQDVPLLITSMRNAFENEDRGHVQRCLRRIRGLSVNVGARLVCGAAIETLEAVESDDKEAIRHGIWEVDRELAKVRALVRG